MARNSNRIIRTAPPPGNWNTTDSKQLAPSTAMYSPDVKFSQFILNEYGNLDFIVDVADSLVDFARKFWRHNKRYQATLTILKYGIPATVFTSQFLAKLNKYRKIKSGDNSTYNEREEKIKQVLDLTGKKDPGGVGCDDFRLGKDVLIWLFHKPKTESFKVLGFFSYENLAAISDIWNKEQETFIVTIEYAGARFAWVLNITTSSMDEILVRESTIYYGSGSYDKKSVLKAVMFKEFLNHFDVKNNIICYHAEGLHVFPRQIIQEEIKQFDINKFTREIRKVLERKKKRGFAFVGVPGTGKSTIIRKLESLITDYPIIYTTASNYESSGDIKTTFMTIEYMQPCIVVLEDLDSYGLRDKKNSLGVFLDQIDDVNNRLNAVFLATINDTSLVHYSLINRPGRLDQIIMVKPPRDPQEVYDVMRTRYIRDKQADENIKEEFLSFESVDQDILQNIVEHQYTHADICEIIEKALLLEDSITNRTLADSLKELKESNPTTSFKNDTVGV